MAEYSGVVAGGEGISAADANVEQHHIAQSIALHLLPGIAATIIYALVTPALMTQGFPPLFSAYLVLAGAIIVLELGFLFYRGRTRNGRLSLQGIVLYREPMPVGQYFIFVPLLLVWGVIITGLASPADSLLTKVLSSWLPDWYLFNDLPQYPTLYNHQLFLALVIVGFIFNGIAGPITEELYFRGYLLPRISRFGRWAPVINTVLFSLYHFWAPGQFISRTLLLLPVVSSVWLKRNIYLGMIVHCLLNTISVIGVATLLLK